MKNIILSLFLAMTVSACSSGSSVADTPFNITGVFNGTFVSNTNDNTRSSGEFTLNIAEDDAGNVSGNIIFANAGGNVDNSCVFSGLVEGSTSGFSVAIDATVPGGTTVTVDDEDGNPMEVDISGAQINYQLTQSNNGNTLTGTFVSQNLARCSNFSGSGTVDINRR